MKLHHWNQNQIIQVTRNITNRIAAKQSRKTGDNQVDMLKTAQQMEDEPLVSTEQKRPSNKIGQNNKHMGIKKKVVLE